MPTDTDLISKVRGVLMDAARAGKTITFSEVEKKVGEQIGAWRKVLDPIYEDCVARGQRWSRLSEQFLRIDKWSVCRG
jgi:hypothetical protein